MGISLEKLMLTTAYPNAAGFAASFTRSLTKLTAHQASMPEMALTKQVVRIMHYGPNKEKSICRASHLLAQCLHRPASVRAMAEQFTGT
jgi:hypothetical protein